MTGDYNPESITNYTPVLYPMPPLTIETVCDAPLVCVSFSAEFLPYLLGLLEIYRWPDRFAGTDAEKTHSIGLIQDLIGELTMGCCCNGQELTIRILNSVNIYGEWNISIDEGETWSPNPDDPRNIIPVVDPPIPSGAVANTCDAASNVLEHLQDVQAGISHDLEITTTLLEFLIAAIESVLAAILFETGLVALEPLVPIIGEIFRGLFGHTSAAYDALFTNAVWDAVLCILYCNISDNGQYTETQFQAVVAQCAGSIPGGFDNFSAAASIQAMIKTWGRNGLNRAASFGNASSADCSSCNCNCVNLVIVVGTLLEYNDQTCEWTIQSAHSSSGQEIQVRFSDPYDINECAKIVEFAHVSGASWSYNYYAACGTSGLNFALSINTEGNRFGFVNTGDNQMVYKLSFVPIV